MCNEMRANAYLSVQRVDDLGIERMLRATTVQNILGVAYGDTAEHGGDMGYPYVCSACWRQ